LFAYIVTVEQSNLALFVDSYLFLCCNLGVLTFAIASTNQVISWENCLRNELYVE